MSCPVTGQPCERSVECFHLMRCVLQGHTRAVERYLIVPAAILICAALIGGF